MRDETKRNMQAGSPRNHHENGGKVTRRTKGNNTGTCLLTCLLLLCRLLLPRRNDVDDNQNSSPMVAETCTPNVICGGTRATSPNTVTNTLSACYHYYATSTHLKLQCYSPHPRYDSAQDHFKTVALDLAAASRAGNGQWRVRDGVTVGGHVRRRPGAGTSNTIVSHHEQVHCRINMSQQSRHKCANRLLGMRTADKHETGKHDQNDSIKTAAAVKRVNQCKPNSIHSFVTGTAGNVLLELSAERRGQPYARQVTTVQTTTTSQQNIYHTSTATQHDPKPMPKATGARVVQA